MMKFVSWKVAMLALALALGIGAVGCKRGDSSPIGVLGRSLESVVGHQPNLVLTLNFKAIRNSPPAQDLMKQYRSRMISLFEQSEFKHCDVPQIVDKLDSAAVLSFDNMNWMYASIQGSFDMQKTVACVEKHAKEKVPTQTIHGKKVYTLQKGFAWVAGPNTIVALTPTPKTRRVQLGDAKLRAEGAGGLLEKLLQGKGTLTSGTIPALSDHILSFRLNKLPETKGTTTSAAMPLPFKFPTPQAVWGSLMVGEQVTVLLGAALESAEVAKDVKNSLAGLAMLAPDKFSDSLKVTNSEKTVQIAFKHSTKDLVEIAKKAAVEQMKKLKNNPFRVPGVKFKSENSGTAIHKTPSPPGTTPKAAPIEPPTAVKPQDTPSNTRKSSKKDDDDE